MFIMMEPLALSLDAPSLSSCGCALCRLSFAKNASEGIVLRCCAFVAVMQAAEVWNLDDRTDARDLPNMRTLLVEC